MPETTECACGCGTVIPPYDASRKRQRKYASRSHNHKRQENALFWEKVLKTQSCWLWQGSKDEFGYGMITTDRVCKRAHIRSWEIHHGEIPKGKRVLHNC